MRHLTEVLDAGSVNDPKYDHGVVLEPMQDHVAVGAGGTDMSGEVTSDVSGTWKFLEKANLSLDAIDDFPGNGPACTHGYGGGNVFGRP